MNAVLSSYLPIVIFIGVALVVGLALIAAPFLLASRRQHPKADGAGSSAGTPNAETQPS